jgi:hypothetical protein
LICAAEQRSLRPMETHVGSPLTTSVLALVVLGCGDNGAIPGDMFGTVSDSVTGTSSDAGDGADETAGSQPSEVEDHCLFDPVDMLYGYRYQCEGSVAINVEIVHPFDGSPVSEPFVLDFGAEVDGDSYESPRVMACCPPYDLAEPQCGQPHQRACWIDVVEQGCKSLVGKLDDIADSFGVLEGAKKQAVLKVRDYVRDHQSECFDSFAAEVAGTLQECDQDFNGQPFADWVEAGVWSFEPAGPVETVEITVAAAAWTGLFPLDEHEPAPETCWSADENDGTLFLEIDPNAGEVMHLASGSVSIHGPDTDGAAELSSTSTLAITTGAAPALENLALHSAGPALIVSAGIPVPVESFHVRLWDRAPAMATGSAVVIPARRARFAAAATAFGESRVRLATNATPIVITHGAHGGWRSDQFALEAIEAHGREWSVVIGPARWQ